MHVVVVGGGLAGCGVAWKLAQQGCQVTVLDQGEPGQQASSAAAGILGAQVELKQPGPAMELALDSRALYPTFVSELEHVTGTHLGYRQCGVLSLAPDAAAASALQAVVALQQRQGMDAQWLVPDAVRELEPEISAPILGGAHFPQDAQVHAPKLVQALVKAARAAGAKVQGNTTVTRILQHNGKVTGVEAGGETIPADVVLLAAGAWASRIAGSPLGETSVRPVRGQMVRLLPAKPVLSRIVFTGHGYLVPRVGEGILVGSTMEEAGFEAQVTAAGLAGLLGMATHTAPVLRQAVVDEAWAGLRPASLDGAPLLGRSNVEGLFVAGGHFRNGVLLAPITSLLLSDMILGRSLGRDVSMFSPQRLA